MNSLTWQERLSPFQQAFLKRAWLIGGILFFVGIQLSVRGKGDIGEWLAGFGIFIAAELMWGLKKLYNWIERRRPQWIQKYGYRKLFWILIFVGFGVNLVGFISLFLLTTNFLATYLAK